MKSMTGYGIGEVKWKGRTFHAEARSLNHRSIDIRVRVPRGYLLLELEIVKYVREMCARGSIDIFVEEAVMASGGEFSLDAAAARNVLSRLKKLQRLLAFKGEIQLEHLMPFREFFFRSGSDIDHEGCHRAMFQAFKKAMKDLGSMRMREGKALRGHIMKILDRILAVLKDCEEKAPLVLTEIRNRMKAKISTLLEKGQEIDKGRLEQELAFYAERHDISEEVERLKSHHSQASSLLDLDGPVGVKLGFIFQEMAREAGTLVSKAGNSTLTQYALELRTWVEKAREQVQNIE